MKINVAMNIHHLAIKAGHLQFNIPLINWSTFVQDLLTHDEYRREEALFVVQSLFASLDECFPGETFAGFADAPDDNSITRYRQRSAQDLVSARRSSTAFAVLKDANVDEKTMQTLATQILRQCRNGTLDITLQSLTESTNQARPL